MFISYGANSTSKAPRPTYSSSGKSSTVSQKRPQTEHCYGQHRAICSRHAVTTRLQTRTIFGSHRSRIAISARLLSVCLPAGETSFVDMQLGVVCDQWRPMRELQQKSKMACELSHMREVYLCLISYRLTQTAVGKGS